MKWSAILRTMRDLRQKDIPFMLGANAFLLSPWIPSSNDDGWRIRIAQSSLSMNLSHFEKIVQDMDLSLRSKKYGETQYLEIYQSGYCDPIHKTKIDNSQAAVHSDNKEVLSSPIIAHL